MGHHVSHPTRRRRTLRTVPVAVGRARSAVPEAVRFVTGSVGVAVAVTLALATWGVPTTPATPASEPTFPRTTVPMCEDVHGGAGSGAGGSSPAEHPPGAWDDWASDLHAWARSEVGDRFAGSWGRTVAFTDDVEELGEHAQGRFNEELEIIEVNHSLEDLEQVHRAALAEKLGQADEFGPEGLPEAGQLIDVTTLTRANRVRLTVADLDTRRAEELTRRYGALHICLEDHPLPGPHDAEPAPFEPVDGTDLPPESTRIEVLVNERGCAGGRSADGRIPTPRVDADEERVVVTVRVVPLPGPQDCGEAPDTPFTIELDEPLGDRTLLDGSADPAAEPSLDEHR